MKKIINNPNDVVTEMLQGLAKANPNVVYAGEGVTEEDSDRTAQLFAAACPDAEVAALPGGQPVYYYIIAIE